MKANILQKIIILYLSLKRFLDFNTSFLEQMQQGIISLFSQFSLFLNLSLKFLSDLFEHCLNLASSLVPGLLLDL